MSEFASGLIFEPHGGYGSGLSDTGTIIKASNPRRGEPFPFGYISTRHPQPIFQLDTVLKGPEDELQALALQMAAAPDLVEALVAAKRELWEGARGQWNVEDFKNWAVVQQIDAALRKARGQSQPPKAA